MPESITTHLIDLYLRSISSLDLTTQASENGVHLDCLACPQLITLCSHEKYT